MVSAQSSSSGQRLTIYSKEGTPLDISVRACMQQSELIQELMDAGEEEAETLTIPRVDVTHAILQLVKQYVEYHEDNPPEAIEKPLRGNIEDVICSFDKKFIESIAVNQTTLVELTMASYKLEIKDLTDLTCAWIASKIRSKSPEQIRDMFGIENNFTPEEEEQIRRENMWSDEE